MKHVTTQKFFIHAEKSYHSGEINFLLYQTDMSKYGYVCLGEFETDIEFEVPDNANVTGLAPEGD